MAIHIWKDNQYVPVDLAQYGQDGQLTGAYVWRDGAWRTLWERGTGVPEPLWSDDFTSPTLHERWQLLDGEYSPPGLTDVVVLGPQIDDNCRIDIEGISNGGGTQLLIVDASFNLFAVMVISGGWVSLEVPASGYYDSTPLTGTPTLQRQNGVWTVLVDGQPVQGNYGPITAPDGDSDLYLALVSVGSTITSVSYTVL